MANRYADVMRTPQQVAAGYAPSLTPATPANNPSGFDPRRLPQGSNPSALTIDQVNIAMRASPVWNSWMQQHGINPGSVHLNDSQKNGLAKSLELAGFPLPDGWEIDNSGNIREETHKLRNTAIIAGATAAAVFGGPAVYAALAHGGTTGAAAGFSTGLGSTGAASTAGALAGYGTVAPAVTGFSTGAALTGAGSTAGMLSGYGAVEAPSVLGSTATTGAVGGLAPALTSGSSTAGFGGAGGGTSIYGAGARAAGAGSGLGSEALRYGLGTGGNIVGSLIQANATRDATAAQQKYLEEALAYAKEQDAYARQVAAQKVQLEAGRYSDYTGRIAPYLATGSDANTRMASLLGLPSGSAPPANPMGASSAAPRITTNDPQSHVYPTPPVSGPPTTVPSPGVPPGAGVPNPYDVPRGTSGMVLMAAPDGTQRQIPASQVQHYLSRGASIV